MTTLAPVGLAAALRAVAAPDRPITIGLAGAGQMGTDIVVQIALMEGIRLGAIAEVREPAAIDALGLAGRGREAIVTASSATAIEAAIEQGRVAVTGDAKALCAAAHIDVVIDATGNPNIGTAIALDAMAHRKHVVMLNVEADITIGRHLKAEAQKAGVVYTGAAGDEPACTLELIGFAQALGFEVVCAGKGKNNPLKVDAMPADYEAEAARRQMSPRMLVEFVDGSKTMIEMVAVANATGLVPDVPGMHGPAAGREELAQVLCTREDGGILGRSGVVDYSIGTGVAPGVFVVIKPRHPRIMERLTDLKVGKGPCYALLRPYHLTSLEVPLSALRAARFGQADMAPLDHPVAECTALAKRDLAAGETLGKIGESDYRGFAMTWREARDGGRLPLGLAERAVTTTAIRKGEPLTYANCRPDDSLLVTQIRRRQDQADSRLVGS